MPELGRIIVFPRHRLGIVGAKASREVEGVAWLRPERSSEICATTLLRGRLQNFSLARAMPPKKAEEAAAPPAADDDGLAELATRALPPAFDDDALAALVHESVDSPRKS